MAAFELRSELSRCSTLIAETPVSGVSQGEFVALAGLVNGFALTDTTRPQGSLTSIQTGGNAAERPNYTLVVKAPECLAIKYTNEAFIPGDDIYFDGTKVTGTASGNKKIGYCKERAATADATVLMEFDGTLDVLVD